MSDDKQVSEHTGNMWEKISASLQPETKDLPKDDRRYFESRIKFLIGKEIRLSNIEDAYKEYLFRRRGQLIIKSNRYPMLFTREDINSKLAEFLLSLGLPISRDGLGWKYGPMGFQQQHLKQEVINMPTVTGK